MAARFRGRAGCGLTAPVGSGSSASRTRNRAATTAIEELEELTDTPAEVGLPDVVDHLVPATVPIAEVLGGSDVLGAGALRALAERKRHGIAFAQGVEWRARARGLVEEVFDAVGRGDEAEAPIRDALDCAGRRCHA